MPEHLPQGLAIKLPKGSYLLLHSHLHPSGKKEKEQMDEQERGREGTDRRDRWLDSKRGGEGEGGGREGERKIIPRVA